MSARLTPDVLRLRAVSEAQWQRVVLDLCRMNGWKTYVAPRAGIRANGTVRQVEAGWPDVCAVRGPRLLFAELKRETGRTTPAQEEWLAALTAASVEVYVWKPSDLAEVRAVLAHRQESR